MEQNTKEQQEQERREARRKRRIRNQILAYCAVIILIVATAAGIVFGVRYLTQTAGRKEQAKQDQVNNLIGTEESLQEPEPSTEEKVTELSPEQKLDEIVNARIEVMPIEDKVAGLFIVTPESITGVGTAVKAGDGTKAALTKYSVGGVVYDTKNIQNENQFKEMIDATKLYASYPLFVTVKDEGGKVSPLQEKGLAAKQDGAGKLAENGEPDKAYEAGAAIGTYLKEYGFNLDLAPVADINSVENSVMKDRVYGSDADKASPYVVSMVQGLQDQGVSACLKHFPGMGSTTMDTEKGLAATDRSEEDFRANEFKVFKAGIDANVDMVMVSHMAAASLTGDNTPCSMSSKVVTEILRGELGFDGVIVTDSMSAKAVSEYYDAGEAAVKALKAGCDMVLMPEDFEKAYNGVLEAVQSGVISEDRINDSLRRIYRIKDSGRIE